MLVELFDLKIDFNQELLIRRTKNGKKIDLWQLKLQSIDEIQIF